LSYNFKIFAIKQKNWHNAYIDLYLKIKDPLTNNLSGGAAQRKSLVFRSVLASIAKKTMWG
jgi:hypothetical protein